MRRVVRSGVFAAAFLALVGVAADTASAQVRTSQIGVSIRDLTADEIASAKLAPAGGARIERVRAGSPAARAGLREGDIVVEFDGERVRSASHFTRLVRETAPGRTVAVTVVRDGTRTTLDITTEESDRLSWIPGLSPELELRLRNLPRVMPRDFDFQLPDDLDPTPDLRRGAPPARLGLTLRPLTDQLASYFGVKSGALVASVQRGSAAEQAGIKAGDVITSINGREVRDSRDIVREVRSAKPGSTLDVRLFRDRKEMTLKVTIPELVTEPRSVLPV